MKMKILLSITLFISLNIPFLAQCPGVDVIFTSQAELDDFVQMYPDCDSIKNGNLVIGPSTDIVDLSGLISLRFVKKDIVIADNDSLISLTGLDSIHSFGYSPGQWIYGSLIIRNNDLLPKLSGFGNPSTIWNLFVNVLISDNDALVSLEGMEDFAGTGFYDSSFDGAQRRGGLVIENNNDLVNLQGLDGLTYGIVEIKENDNLQNLEGLGSGFNYSSWIENYLFITDNDGLVDLHGLDSITSIRSLTISDNNNLETLEGLGSLSLINGGYVCSEGCGLFFGLEISNNNKLQSLEGIENLETVRGYLNILENEQLLNFHGLDSLKNMYDGHLVISENPSLLNIEALNQLESIGFFYNYGDVVGASLISISHNAQLASLIGLGQLDSLLTLAVVNNASLISLAGLESLISVGGALTISENESLASFNGLNQLEIIGGELKVKNNDSLSNFHGLENLTSIGLLPFSYLPYMFIVEGNESLISFDGLENLNSFRANHFQIRNNPALVSLSGLDSLEYEMIEDFFIKNCPNLTVCNIQPICDFFENGGLGSVSDNAPGCNSVSEIEAACEVVAVEEVLFRNETIQVFPNPVNDFLNIQLPETITKPTEVSIIDLQGKTLKKQKVNSSQSIEVAQLPAGMYLIKVVVDSRIYSGRFIK